MKKCSCDALDRGQWSLDGWVLNLRFCKATTKTVIAGIAGTKVGASIYIFRGAHVLSAEPTTSIELLTESLLPTALHDLLTGRHGDLWKVQS